MSQCVTVSQWCHCDGRELMILMTVSVFCIYSRRFHDDVNFCINLGGCHGNRWVTALPRLLPPVWVVSSLAPQSVGGFTLPLCDDLSQSTRRSCVTWRSDQLTTSTSSLPLPRGPPHMGFPSSHHFLFVWSSETTTRFRDKLVTETRFFCHLLLILLSIRVMLIVLNMCCMNEWITSVWG